MKSFSDWSFWGPWHERYNNRDLRGDSIFFFQYFNLDFKKGTLEVKKKWEGSSIKPSSHAIKFGKCKPGRFKTEPMPWRGASHHWGPFSCLQIFLSPEYSSRLHTPFKIIFLLYTFIFFPASNFFFWKCRSKKNTK